MDWLGIEFLFIVRFFVALAIILRREIQEGRVIKLELKGRI